MLFCFFFQAEDGIRDWSVTGVQTCALPISVRPYTTALSIWRMTVNPDIVRRQIESAVVYGLTAALYGKITFKDGRVEQRSEERRVGKEGRSRGGGSE